LIWVER